MKNDKELPEDRRERLRQKELKGNPSSSIHGSGLQDLVGGMSWKVTGLFIIAIVIGFILFFLVAG